jgi:hypothetical protein
MGISKREWDEFVEKARFKPRDNDFQLDIAGALSGEHFEALPQNLA